MIKVLWEGKVPSELHCASSEWKKGSYRLVLRDDPKSVLGEVLVKKDWLCCEPGIESWMMEELIKVTNGLKPTKIKSLKK